MKRYIVDLTAEERADVRRLCHTGGVLSKVSPVMSATGG